MAQRRYSPATAAGAGPVAIDQPAPTLVAGDVAAVRAHIEQWRRVREGEVHWEAVSYRSLADPVELPVGWVLHSAEQWVEAMADADIRREYRLLAGVIEAVEPRFHPLIVRHRQHLLAHGAIATYRAGTRGAWNRNSCPSSWYIAYRTAGARSARRVRGEG